MAGQNPLGFVARSFQKAFTPGQIGQQSDLWNSLRHGKLYAAAYGTPAIVSPAAVAQAGALFRGSNQAGATLSAALATTYTGLCLNNPAASGVNLVVRRISGVTVVAPAAELAFGLITGWLAAGITTHTTSLDADIISAYVGGAPSAGSIVAPASKAHLDAACTLVGTPIWDRWIAAGNASTNNVNFNLDTEDDLIIPPGAYAAIGANVAGPTAGMFATFEWEELAP